MSAFADAPAFSIRAALARGEGLLVFWVVSIGANPADLVVGLIAASSGSATSFAPPRNQAACV